MKIAYTISGLYNSGGMENILIQKANYLADNLGYDVSIITTDQKDRKVFFPLSKKVKLVDLGINYCDARSKRFWHIKKFLLKRCHRKALEEYLLENKFDIVISLFTFDFTFLHKIEDGSRKILEYHFAKYSKVHATDNQLKKIIQKIRAHHWEKIVAKYDRFIVLTEEDKQQWGNIPNIQVIPNFIKKIPEIKAELRNKRVISVGRADFQKGFDMLIEAWKIVSKNYPDWRLSIVGGGNKTGLQSQIDQLHLGNYIELLPPNPDIENDYLKSSLYVMSSRYEGLPLVLLEAMSYGLPIVSFSCPCGPKDILKSSFSSLVECNNIEHLAQSINIWLEDEDNRIIAGREAGEEVKKYSVDQIMAKWDRLFKIINNEI